MFGVGFDQYFFTGFLIGLVVGLIVVTLLMLFNIKIPILSSFSVLNDMSWDDVQNVRMMKANSKDTDDYGYAWQYEQ